MSRDAIEDLVHRYSDAVVHADREQWGATWADDAVWDLGKDRRFHGREAILDGWAQAMTRFEFVVQTVMNGTITLDDDAGTGVGRWYIHEVMERAGGDRETMIGHYDDTYIRTEHGWRFLSRELTQHFRGSLDG